MNTIQEREVQTTAINSTICNLRPRQFTDYIGQTKVINQLKVFIGAAKSRHESLDHVLLFGPPGLGKTTLAQIIANEMHSNIKQTSGPILEKAGDLAALLTNLEAHDILFIDEIHRLHPSIEEILYPAMEDYQIDIMVGEGPSARSLKLDLPPFTLVGATTKAGTLTSPLRDRFGIIQRLEYYNPEELSTIIIKSATKLGVNIQPQAALTLAQRARGTPRLANRLLRRIRDFAQQKQADIIHCPVVLDALEAMDIDTHGFDNLDRKYLHALVYQFSNGPVGVDALAATIGETRTTVEDILEPFLIQQGFVQRSPRGRVATELLHNYFNNITT